MRIKAVQLAVQSALPESMQGQEVPLTAKGISALMYRVAIEHPEQYSAVLKKVGDLGRNAAYWQGETVGLDDLRDALDTRPYFKVMDKEVRDAQKGVTDPDKRDAIRERIWAKMATLLEKDTMKAALASGNSLGRSVASGARGKPLQLRAMLATPALFEDSKGRMIPIFARNSYGRGISPGEFLAGTYGARSSVVSTKTATAKGGFLGKQMAQTMAGLVVTEDDCGTTNGIDLPISDRSLRNRFLARKTGTQESGSLLDRKALSRLQDGKVDTLLVRSPMTCKAARGVCGKCVGADPTGKLPEIGFAAGVTAANAISEPLTQMALNVKHCLLQGTLVRMADLTVKPIESIRPGDWVLGADITGATFPVQVKHLWDQGVQDVNTYTYRLGQTKQYVDVTCTEDHPILSNKKVFSLWHKQKTGSHAGPLNDVAVKLPAGYKHKNIAAVLPNSCDIPGGLDEPLAQLCGVLFGDGIRWDQEASRTPTLSCADPVLVQDLNVLLASYGVHLVKRQRSHDYALSEMERRVQPTDNKTGRFVSTGVLGIMKTCQLAWGLADKYAHEKSLPSGVLNWSFQSVCDIIAGFIAADGSVGVNGSGQGFISFCSTSRQMLEQFQELLKLRLCVYSSAITQTNEAGERNYTHDMWAFTITRQDQIRRLLSLINIPGVKKEAAQKVLALDYEVRNAEPFFRALRKKITPVGPRPCWDLSVDHPDELFVLANGLIVKNTSGASKEKKSYSGLDWLIRFVQIPEEFPDRAPVAEQDGDVAISVAPQGGHIVRVGEAEHYVPQHLPLLVKNGQTVEAGTPLSQGVMRPDDIVRLRGLGEGRRHMATRFKEMLDDSGTEADSRNVEMLARASVNHVRILDTDQSEGGILPDDVVPYDEQERHYEPPEDALPGKPSTSLGQFLHTPALHYSIGTRITPSVAERLEKTGFDKVLVSPNAPGFTPEMPRLQTATFAQPDWMAAMGTSYLKRQLSQRAQRGQDSNIKSNIHFAPRLAVGEDFGRNIRTTGEF